MQALQHHFRCPKVASIGRTIHTNNAPAGFAVVNLEGRVHLCPMSTLNRELCIKKTRFTDGSQRANGGQSHTFAPQHPPRVVRESSGDFEAIAFAGVRREKKHMIKKKYTKLSTCADLHSCTLCMQSTVMHSSGKHACRIKQCSNVCSAITDEYQLLLARNTMS